MSVAPPASSPLTRGLGLWQAVAINVTQIVGAGVFATVPIILGVLPGAYGLLAWLVAGALIVLDGMIWSELGAALPAAGGSYHFLLESYGRSRWGRLMAFLFVWQILISGPLEVGSGLVAIAQFVPDVDAGFKKYDEAHTSKYEIKIADEPAPDGKVIGIKLGPARLIGFGFGVLILALLYRKVNDLGRLSVVFLLGVLALLGWVLVAGASRFDPALALDTTLTEAERPKSAALALGAGMGFAIYSYFGYYNVCYLGAEVRDPARTIPRAILLSAGAVVVLFVLVHLAMTGVVPWREAKADPVRDNLTAEFMRRIHGDRAAAVVSVLLIGSCFASCFAGILGYSRVPYAAAKEGHFLRWFAAVHPTLHIPHRSLLLIGGMVLFWSFFSLDAVIQALLVTRILEQFLAQVFAVSLLRKRNPDRPRPWKMWLYPLPCLLAFVGWVFVYVTTDSFYILVGLGTLLTGLVVFIGWSYARGVWPFAPADNTRPILPTSRD
jgi:amino acid transporter